jgi:hypothetical protein
MRHPFHMKQIAKRITFHELLKQPDGTEFTACFTDDVKRGLPPVILKKRSPRSYAERALGGVQILGTDRDGMPHAIPNGTASFSVTLGSAEPEPVVSVNPEWTDAELAAIQQLATEKDMPPSQVIRQALRAYQETHQIAVADANRRVLGTASFGGWGVDLILAHDSLWLCGTAANATEHFAAAVSNRGAFGIHDVPATIDIAALSAFVRDAIQEDSSRPDAPVQSDSPRGE